MKILCKFPTRGRPNVFAQTMYKYQTMATSGSIDFLVTIDRNDASMNHPRTLNNIKQWPNVMVDVIEPCGKIGAINAGIDNHIDNYDVILLASDDMIPQFNGYDERIINDMKEYFPDTDGVLWYNDGYTQKKLNTLCILGRKYYKRFGYIYHPSYKSLWCDNEFMDVANSLNKQVYSEDVIIRHEHPVWMPKGVYDALHWRDMNNQSEDQQNYERRKADHFGARPVIEYFDTNSGVKEASVPEDNGGVKPADKRRRVRKKSTDM